jgi:hypothetical protein
MADWPIAGVVLHRVEIPYSLFDFDRHPPCPSFSNVIFLSNQVNARHQSRFHYQSPIYF